MIFKKRFLIIVALCFFPTIFSGRTTKNSKKSSDSAVCTKKLTKRTGIRSMIAASQEVAEKQNKVLEILKKEAQAIVRNTQQEVTLVKPEK